MRAEEDKWLERPPLHATVRVLNMSFFRKIITRHDTGLGEAYMDEDYKVTPSAFPDCYNLLTARFLMTTTWTTWRDVAPERLLLVQGSELATESGCM